MHIGIDARLLYYSAGGISRYIRALITALAQIDHEDSFTIFQYRKEQASPDWGHNFRRRLLWTPPHHPWERWTLPWEMVTSPLDVIHSPDFIPPFYSRGKRVITVHDLAFLRFPQLLTPASRRYYQQIHWAVKRAHGIAAVSEATRQDMVELLGVPPERIQVIYHAVDDYFHPVVMEKKEAFRLRHHLPERFILWVGVIEPRKNLDTLLRALAWLRQEGHRYSLVVVGSPGWLYQGTFRLIEELEMREDVVLFGSASLEELLFLYNCAWLFIFPSLYEGFGFPPLEAMACGTPVISSNTPSLVEVLGEAPIYFSPQDVSGLAQAILQVDGDAQLRKNMGRRGRERALRYSWRRTAEETLSLYRRVLA
ncbi:MAG: glycosyltransferase family 4 protein [Chloroflexi bacterium]|nr:glycosyltransferase family 4 protein [Chloroflexota bacterium]